MQRTGVAGHCTRGGQAAGSGAAAAANRDPYPDEIDSGKTLAPPPLFRSAAALPRFY